METAEVSRLLLAALLCLPLVCSAKYHRSQEAKAAFQRQVACPATGRHRGKCPGYVIDHVKPLACGGADAPENMAWQAVADAKAKDRWERKDCHSLRVFR